MTTGISLLNPEKPTIHKAPGANLDYGFDWTEWLAEHGGDAISSATVTPFGGVAVTPAAHNGSIVTTMVSGGDVDTEAGVTCSITTVGPPALTDSRTIWLRIAAR